MSMNQSTILSFLSNPSHKVMLDTSYTNAFGKTPGRIARLLRDEPDNISGGFSMVGSKVKDRAHAVALRALVREKRVSLKVDSTGEHPMIVVTRKTLRGRPPKETHDETPTKRTYTFRTKEEKEAEKTRVKRKYTRKAKPSENPTTPAEPIPLTQPVPQEPVPQEANENPPPPVSQPENHQQA